MITTRIEPPKDRRYFSATDLIAIASALDAQFNSPPHPVLDAAYQISFLLVIMLLVAPFIGPVREMVGWYFYVHILVVMVALVLFRIYIGPTLSATEKHRRCFMERANDKRLIQAGLDVSGISSTRLAKDGHTLEIFVTGDWFDRPPETRLRDAQHFWLLWTKAYNPYEGNVNVHIRLLDSLGNEIGGSHPEESSLVWAK